MKEQILTNIKQQDYSPFDRGVAKAISSTRNNLAMTQDQEHQAINNALLQFGKAMAQEPKEKGFFNNLGAVGRSASAGLENYNQSKTEALKDNQALANQIEDRLYRDKMLGIKREDNDWSRKFQQAKFDAEQDYKKQMLELKKQKYGGSSELDNIAPIIRTDSAFDKIGDKTEAAANFYNEVEEVKHLYEDLKSTMNKAGIDTTNPLSFKKAIRDASGILSSFTKDPVKRDIAKKYADLDASNKRAMQTAEKALSNKALTDFTVRYGDEKNLFPNFKENFDIYETKLNHMLDDARKGYEAANLSMQTGRRVNKKNFELVRNLIENQHPQQLNNAEIEPIPANEEQRSITQETVLMQDKNAIQYNIPIFEVEDALNDGLSVVE